MNICNIIRSLKDESSREATTFNQLADIGIRDFSHLFKYPREETIEEVIRIVKLLPWFVDEDNLDNLNKPVAPREIEVVLKWFKRKQESET